MWLIAQQQGLSSYQKWMSNTWTVWIYIMDFIEILATMFYDKNKTVNKRTGKFDLSAVMLHS